MAVALTWFAAPGTALAAPTVFEEGEATTRSIAENTEIPETWLPIGAPVRATDADGDTLTYSVDLSHARLVDATGQIFSRRGTQIFVNHEETSEVILLVTASDGPNTDTIEVTVYNTKASG